MTNEEIWEKSYGRDGYPFNALELARADERAKLSKEIYRLQTEIIQINGIRISVIPVHELQSILPKTEKGF